MAEQFDVLLVADCRFAGGTTAALVADATAMSALGLRIGLFFVRSSYLDDARDPPNPRALALADLDGVTLLGPGTPARAELAFLHHPLIFFRGIEERLDLQAERSVIVAHAAPFRADGSLEYDPIATIRRVRAQTGLSPWFAPIAGGVRAQLASFAPFVRCTTADWPNIFEPNDWPVTSDILTRADLTIGRHGRPDVLKFPTTGAEIDASLPASEQIRVRVLGCPVAELRQKGAQTDRWDVLEFGTEAVPDFLNTLDIFTYHYHENWFETFGRTVAEAILCGRPCLLDPRLEPTFGDMAQYCAPGDTADALRRLADHRDATKAQAARARARAIGHYGAAGMARRIAALNADAGVIDRQRACVGATQTLRKVVGLYRRRARGLTG